MGWDEGITVAGADGLSPIFVCSSFLNTTETFTSKKKGFSCVDSQVAVTNVFNQRFWAPQRTRIDAYFVVLSFYLCCSSEINTNCCYIYVLAVYALFFHFSSLCDFLGRVSNLRKDKIVHDIHSILLATNPKL